MPIDTPDIIYRLSGGAANADPNASLGGAKSGTAMPLSIFDDVPSVEAVAGHVEYRCIYIHNAHATLTMLGTRAWMQENTPSPTTTFDLGVGTSAAGATEQTIADEKTAPVDVAFVVSSDYSTGIVLGDILPGEHRAIWIRRTVGAGTTVILDTALIRVECDTNP
ncbi:hypothetical protein [Thauera sp.]|uniref:hypothetical protein n=1 Tax=Thauera sp. TaxID=1905334 RepID=UPI0039E6F516